MNRELLHEPSACANLVELLRWRAARQPDRPAYSFLLGGEMRCIDLNYGELDRRDRAIGASLQKQANPGSRALLLYPAGLEFIAAFFGCLYAGMVAIPAFAPDLGRA